jgi:hypothetical protein
MMKLVEECAGMGELILNGTLLRRARYRIHRYQGMTRGSELPIPGLFRLEGSIDFDPATDSADWLGVPLALKLQDGRTVGITIAGPDGRVLSEGHGPMKCQCC